MVVGCQELQSYIFSDVVLRDIESPVNGYRADEWQIIGIYDVGGWIVRGGKFNVEILGRKCPGLGSKAHGTYVRKQLSRFFKLDRDPLRFVDILGRRCLGHIMLFVFDSSR